MSAVPPSLLPTPLQAAALLTACVVAGLLALQRPPVTRGTALAVTPWAIAGGLLVTLAARGAYPPAIAALFTPALAPVSTFSLAGLAWAPLVQVATLRGRIRATPAALATAGGGVATVLVVVVLVRFPLSPEALFWVAFAPVAGTVVAAVAYFLLGLRYAGALAYTRVVGLLVVLGQAFDGVAVAVADLYLGGGPGRPVIEAAERALVPALGPRAVWAVVGLKVGLALAAVVALTPGARDGRGRTLALLGLLVAAGVGPAVATVTLAATG